MNKYFKPSKYKSLLLSFKTRGYIFSSFLNYQKSKSIILRHDVDFNIDYAYQMACIEKKLGIKSSYFFLMTSNFYNIFSSKNINLIKKIKKMGNTISVHFDPSIYKNISKGLINELKIFEKTFNVKIKIFSLHRPRKFIKKESFLRRIKHTYQKEFFQNITYISDSGGSFSYKDPINSADFKNFKTIQLLIHPIWWMQNGSDPSKKIFNWIKKDLIFKRFEIIKNCKTYNKKKLSLK
tara:strand:+ start:3082 stop:3792 length:711 start_codon:yes stop_codon:yes gene_type:complete